MHMFVALVTILCTLFSLSPLPLPNTSRLTHFPSTLHTHKTRRPSHYTDCVRCSVHQHKFNFECNSVWLWLSAVNIFIRKWKTLISIACFRSHALLSHRLCMWLYNTLRSFFSDGYAIPFYVNLYVVWVFFRTLLHLSVCPFVLCRWQSEFCRLPPYIQKKICITNWIGFVYCKTVNIYRVYQWSVALFLLCRSEQTGQTRKNGRDNEKRSNQFDTMLPVSYTKCTLDCNLNRYYCTFKSKRPWCAVVRCLFALRNQQHVWTPNAEWDARQNEREKCEYILSFVFVPCAGGRAESKQARLLATSANIVCRAFGSFVSPVHCRRCLLRQPN